MKKGMIKLSVLYPAGEGKTFDMEYFCDKHLPLVSKVLGPDLKEATVEKGLGGGEPGSAAPYAAMGNLYFDSMESFENSFVANAETLLSDIPNFTNGKPVVQISEVLM